MISRYCHMGELVSAVLDGEATDLERAAVRRHLRACAACRGFNAFSQATKNRAREDLGPPAGTLRGVGTPRNLSGARLAKEVRRGRGGRAVRHTAATLMVALAFGLILGVGSAQVLNERGPSEAVQPAQGARVAPSWPLDPDFIRRFETPPRERVVPLEVAGSAAGDVRFVESFSLEDYRPSPKLARSGMTP
ncbi:MAG: zf-HC2 domain-containing protein [Thermoleophilia bacterium]|nr:zf-HC2 domain-containing protein [Thermoleophilia bacterium]